MNRIQQLAKICGQHIATEWQRTIADSQRVIMIVYHKELERDILAHKDEFNIATRQANHDWFEVDVAPAFAEWMAASEYRDAYFESPADLQLKLESEFRSEEHTSELQSLRHLVCRLLLEKKKCMNNKVYPSMMRRWPALSSAVSSCV